MRIWTVRGYRTVVAVLLVLAVLLAALLASCGTSGDPFAFRAAPFFAEISGAVDGEHVEARLYLDLTEHSTKEIYDVGCIEYRAPESLAGITVGLRSDGVLSARLGELRTEGDFAYLLEPYLPLLSIGEEYDSIVCGKDGNTTVSFRSADGELTYRFSKDGNVLQIDGTWHSHTVNLTVLLLP